MVRKAVSLFTLCCFLLASLVSPAAGQGLALPGPQEMLALSAPAHPCVLKGLKLDPLNPFRFNFVLDNGDEKLENEALRQESDRLIRYFLAVLTTPDKDLWVNLSPYENNRIIEESLGRTVLGRDMLAQDYILKQLSASVIHPDNAVGKKFWQQVYRRAKEKFGTSDVPVNTFHKVWIVPDKTMIHEGGLNNAGNGHGQGGNAQGICVYIDSVRLKVMLETDYLAMSHNPDTQNGDSHHDFSTSHDRIATAVMREVVIPVLEKEVNEGANFARLRKFYHSLLLAVWMKQKLQKAFNPLTSVYIDRRKTGGVEMDNPQAQVQGLYERYVEAFQKGVYNLVREDREEYSREVIPRKYFSGGLMMDNAARSLTAQEGLPGNVSEKSSLIVADLAQTGNGTPSKRREPVKEQKEEKDIGAVPFILIFLVFGMIASQIYTEREHSRLLSKEDLTRIEYGAGKTPDQWGRSTSPGSIADFNSSLVLDKIVAAMNNFFPYLKPLAKEDIIAGLKRQKTDPALLEQVVEDWLNIEPHLSVFGDKNDFLMFMYALIGTETTFGLNSGDSPNKDRLTQTFPKAGEEASKVYPERKAGIENVPFTKGIAYLGVITKLVHYRYPKAPGMIGPLLIAMGYVDGGPSVSDPDKTLYSLQQILAGAGKDVHRKLLQAEKLRKRIRLETDLNIKGRLRLELKESGVLTREEQQHFYAEKIARLMGWNLPYGAYTLEQLREMTGVVTPRPGYRIQVLSAELAKTGKLHVAHFFGVFPGNIHVPSDGVNAGWNAEYGKIIVIPLKKTDMNLYSFRSRTEMGYFIKKTAGLSRKDAIALTKRLLLLNELSASGGDAPVQVLIPRDLTLWLAENHDKAQDGGIDLANAGASMVLSKGVDTDYKFTPEQLETLDRGITGLVPVIVQVSPLGSIADFLNK